ncbi:MAG: MBL fold metallo-hydrolase, partial [Methanomicrobiales archaeon]|nr:MBL fold metallo-hydrolase [Methanomicrobiales archaeon]
MKVSGSVHSFTIPFRIPAGEGHFIERSVRAFLVAGRETCLIDAGVAGSAGSLLALAGNAGGDPGGISTLVLTHSHPDHMGGGLAIQRATGCIVAAHPAEVGWIEDPEQQAR